MTMYAGDESYGDDVTSPTERPLRPSRPTTNGRLTAIESRMAAIEGLLDHYESAVRPTADEPIMERFALIESMIDELESSLSLIRSQQRGMIEAMIEALQQYQ